MLILLWRFGKGVHLHGLTGQAQTTSALDLLQLHVLKQKLSAATEQIKAQITSVPIEVCVPKAPHVACFD